VFLKDGKILKGTIAGETAVNITLQRSGGSSREIIPRENIMRILYTELYMGKVFVQKTDGKGIACYMVDEDRTTYTFRNDINSPTEFTLLRDQVLFIARRNPSGLQGAPSTESIQLKWLPPYNQVKEYRVYLKGPNDADFRRAAATSGKEYKLEGLKSNTSYKMHVTALVREGDESMPSNEITLTTKNICPNPPREINAIKSAPGADGKIAATLRWQAATDPDGSIKGYRVFRSREGEYVRIAEPNMTSYTVSGLEQERRHTFGVCAVDDRGDESDTASVSIGASGYAATVSGAFVLPVGKLADLFKMGYGVTATFTAENVLYDRVEAGIEAGYYRFTSAHYDVEGADRDVEGGYMAPVMVRIGYGFGPYGNFHLTPFLACGLSYNSVTYTNRFLVKTTDSGIEPAVSAGVSARYSLREWWYIHGDCRFTLIAEDEPLYFIALSLGAGMKF
jgi:hypothetical protein